MTAPESAPAPGSGPAPTPPPEGTGRDAERRTARRRRRRLYLRVLGWSLVPLGLAGLVLPVLQGILFLLMAAAILSRVDPRVRLLLRRARKRWPSLDRNYARAEQRVRLWLSRLGLRDP